MIYLESFMLPPENRQVYPYKQMYDKGLEEDGSQPDFCTKIIIPTMAVSGFFTAEQTETILKNIDQAMDMM